MSEKRWDLYLYRIPEYDTVYRLPNIQSNLAEKIVDNWWHSSLINDCMLLEAGDGNPVVESVAGDISMVRTEDGKKVSLYVGDELILDYEDDQEENTWRSRKMFTRN